MGQRVNCHYSTRLVSPQFVGSNTIVSDESGERHSVTRIRIRDVSQSKPRQFALPIISVYTGGVTVCIRSAFPPKNRLLTSHTLTHTHSHKIRAFNPEHHYNYCYVKIRALVFFFLLFFSRTVQIDV